MKALLDTNVVLDLLLAREPYYADARHIWQAAARGQYTGYLSPITPLVVFHIARKLRSTEQAHRAVEQMLGLFEVCPLNSENLNAALGLPLRDYEDAVQYACARSVGADAIITRESKSFTGLEIAVLTPADFLSNV